MKRFQCSIKRKDDAGTEIIYNTEELKPNIFDYMMLTFW